MAASNKTKKAEHGGSRPGSGRKLGSLNKKTIERRKIFEAASRSGETPLEYFLRIMRSGSQPIERRDWAAHNAAPYVHPRLMPLMSAPLRRPDDTAAEIRKAVAQMKSTTIVPAPGSSGAAPVHRTQLVRGKAQ